MPCYYFDSSALVKRQEATDAFGLRYVNEVGSVWVQNITAPRANNQILTAEITLLEVTSALFRKERDGEITVVDRNDALSDFLLDCSDRYVIIQLDRRILIEAIQLFYRHPLRAYDAVQFATAITSNRTLIANSMPALTFVCARSNRRLRLTALAIPRMLCDAQEVK